MKLYIFYLLSFVSLINFNYTFTAHIDYAERELGVCIAVDSLATLIMELSKNNIDREVSADGRITYRFFYRGRGHDEFVSVYRDNNSNNIEIDCPDRENIPQSKKLLIWQLIEEKYFSNK